MGSSTENARPPDANPRRSDTPGRLVWHDLPCPGCGYNLRGLRESRCPECARPFTISGILHESSKAADLGFWPTYKAALLDPRRFWRESGCWLTAASAATLGLGCIALGAGVFATLFACLMVVQQDWSVRAAIFSWGMIFGVAALGLAIAFVLFAATVGLIRLSFGLFTRGAGWRAAAAAAVCFPAWALCSAILITGLGGTLARPIWIGSLSETDNIVLLLAPAIATVAYMGIAAYNEKRPDSDL